jgi:putative addiction module component (TIGR02574 family)
MRNSIFAMPKTLSEVTRDAADLPAVERLKLARILLDLSESDAEPQDEIQAAWDNEIEERIQDLKSGKAKGVPLEEVKRKIEARFRS